MDTGGNKGTQRENKPNADVLHDFSLAHQPERRRSLISQVQFSVTKMQEKDSCGD